MSIYPAALALLVQVRIFCNDFVSLSSPFGDYASAVGVSSVGCMAVLGKDAQALGSSDGAT